MILDCMQVEGCFSQPNGFMCQKMVSWAVSVTRGSKCDVITASASFALTHSMTSLHELALKSVRAGSVCMYSEWDLLELYCGNGNFTVPLAANFRRVVATEVSKASVTAAQHNMKVLPVEPHSQLIETIGWEGLQRDQLLSGAVYVTTSVLMTVLGLCA